MQGLENYETVKSRKIRFYNDHPSGAVHVELISPSEQGKDFVMVQASIWRDSADMQQGYGPDSQGLSLSVAGGKGADRDAWMENCEESAVGRALDNLGYHSGTCSREEMEKAQAHAKQQTDKASKASSEQLAKIVHFMKDAGLTGTEVQALAKKEYGVDKSTELTPEQADDLIVKLEGLAVDQAIAGDEG